MNRSRSITRCRHGVDLDTCPQCNQDARDEWEAVELASRDVLTVEQWRREFEERLSRELAEVANA